MAVDKEKISVCAIIVTYYPDLEKLDVLLSALAEQTSAIIIVDNHSKRELQVYVNAHWESVLLLPLQRNVGVAAAQNRGIEAAIDRGYEYVLLMDQDSVPSQHMVSILHEAHNSLRRSGRNVSGVGPAYINPISEKEPHFFVSGIFGYKRLWCSQHSPERYLRLECLISSGSLLETSAIQRIGYMEEGLFIDHVDTEWFLRAKSLGYDAYGICAASMEHTLGAAAKKYWFFGFHSTIIHPPFRYYFMFRNSAALYKRSYIPVKWKIFDFIMRAKTVLILLLLSGDAWQHVGYIKAGILDGFKDKLGPIR